MEPNGNFKRCNLCAQEIYRSSFAQPLRSINHLIEIGHKLRCEICYAVVSPGFDDDKQIFSEKNLSKLSE